MNSRRRKRGRERAARGINRRGWGRRASPDPVIYSEKITSHRFCSRRKSDSIDTPENEGHRHGHIFFFIYDKRNKTSIS